MSHRYSLNDSVCDKWSFRVRFPWAESRDRNICYLSVLSFHHLKCVKRKEKENKKIEEIITKINIIFQRARMFQYSVSPYFFRTCSRFVLLNNNNNKQTKTVRSNFKCNYRWNVKSLNVCIFMRLSCGCCDDLKNLSNYYFQWPNIHHMRIGSFDLYNYFTSPPKKALLLARNDFNPPDILIRYSIYFGSPLF